MNCYRLNPQQKLSLKKRGNTKTGTVKHYFNLPVLSQRQPPKSRIVFATGSRLWRLTLSPGLYHSPGCFHMNLWLDSCIVYMVSTYLCVFQMDNFYSLVSLAYDSPWIATFLPCFFLRRGSQHLLILHTHTSHSRPKCHLCSCLNLRLLFVQQLQGWNHFSLVLTNIFCSHSSAKSHAYPCQDGLGNEE